MIDRRGMLIGSAALGFAGAKASAAAGQTMTLGPAVPFSFDTLTGMAKDLSQQPFQKSVVREPEILERLDFDAYQEIKFRPELAIWAHGGGPYPVELFHAGRYFREPVRIFVVSANGIAQEVLYSPGLFTYGKSDFAKALPPDTGFAGFRVLAGPGKTDWLAFLGASYFRSPAETGQYGLSSRGLAIDVGMPSPEEFPRFTAFWLEPMAGGAGIAVNALLDSPRITGAYRIETVRRGGTLMTIEARLFPRADLDHAGIAPLTSMFWYAKHNRRVALDWRPEIHDSDGLAIWTGSGERIWRPLNTPPSVQTSTFFDMNPNGFGLLQRERRFSEYEDDGVFYHKRPSVWVEPLGGWGEGAVQLVEIPTEDEIHDNIVAYWLPKEPLRAGTRRDMRYKLHWRLDEPYPAPLAQVSATRIGAGGIPGQPRPKGSVKYVVDFRGGKLSQFSRRGEIDAVVTAASGTVERVAVYPVVDTDKWRAMFDFTAASANPADIRLYLRHGEEALSETWLFQHLPSLSVI
jgi:periplasmic glucans biosynthesis protein